MPCEPLLTTGIKEWENVLNFNVLERRGCDDATHRLNNCVVPLLFGRREYFMQTAIEAMMRESAVDNISMTL